jgi:hypothetical protein
MTDSPTPPPTASDTPTRTITATPSETGTPTFTRTGTPTRTYTPTVTDTVTPTFTISPTWTASPPWTHTVTPTWTITQTFTNTPTPYFDKALDRNYVDVRKGETLKIKIDAPMGTHVKVKVYNLTGEIIRHMEYDTTAAGWSEYEWNLKNDAGRMVGRGMYFVHIDAEGRSVIRRVYIIK